MKKYLFWLPVCLLVFSACKDKKVSLKDGEEVKVTDFIEFFPEVTLPFRIADTTLQQKANDSMLIGNSVFNRFIPDSVLKADFGKAAKPKLYALGRAEEKGKETYLFFKAVSGNKRVGYLASFSEDNEFLKAMPLVRTGGNYSSTYGVLDKKFQITTYHETRLHNDEISFKRNVYFYNSGAKEFTLILTEPNEEIIQNVINPIDTLPAKHKLAGEYVKDKRNYISIRDGRNASEIIFFVHFEKNNGDCKGELKGTARLISAKTAQYQESGNPCALEFTFSSSRVVMKETGGCGSWRDIKCFFEGSYPKKKQAKSSKPNG